MQNDPLTLATPDIVVLTVLEGGMLVLDERGQHKYRMSKKGLAKGEQSLTRVPATIDDKTPVTKRILLCTIPV